MSDHFDPAAAEKRLVAEYGEQIILMTEDERARARVRWIAAVVAGLLLGSAAVFGGRWTMGLSDRFDGAKVATPVATATANLRIAELQFELEKAEKALKESPKESSQAQKEKAARDVALRQVELSDKRAEYARLQRFGAHREALIRRYGDPRGSLWQLADRASAVVGPLALMAGILLILGSLFVPLTPWARQRTASFVESLINALTNPLARTGVAAATPNLAGGLLPAGGAAPRFFGNISLGDFAVRSAVVTSAAVITIGAFSVAIPGRSIDLTTGDPEATTAGVTLGTFDIGIEGKKLTIPADNVHLKTPGSATVASTIELTVPPVTIDQRNDGANALAAELSAYRQFLEGRTVSDAVRAALTEENQTLMRTNSALVERNSTLVEQLSQRVSRSDFEAQNKALTDKLDAAIRTEKALEELHTALNTQRKGTALGALQLVRDINAQNDKIFNSLFRQTLVQQNCQTYDRLSKTFPDLVAPDGCISRTRLGTLNPRNHRVPSPFVALTEPADAMPEGVAVASNPVGERQPR